MKTRLASIAIFVAVALAAVGSYYAYQANRFNDQPVNQAEISADIPKTTITAPNIPQQEVIKPDQERTAEVSQNITAMRIRQQQRDVQVEASRQLVRVPVSVPDLPVIQPLTAAPSLTQRNPSESRFKISQGHTLPPDVMNKFTQETGLSQAEIEQAMNQ